MADEQHSTPGAIPGFMQDFMAQLRGVAERLEGLAGLGGQGTATPSLPSLASLRTMPTPVTFSAAQLTSVASSITAQRRSIDALQTQLTAFDEQLGLLERMLEPLAEWSRTWADLEDRMKHLGHRSGDGDPAGPGDPPR